MPKIPVLLILLRQVEYLTSFHALMLRYLNNDFMTACRSVGVAKRTENRNRKWVRLGAALGAEGIFFFIKKERCWVSQLHKRA